MTELLATCWTHAGRSYPLPGRDISPLSVESRSEAVAAAGFTGIGLDYGDLRAYSSTSSLKDLKRLWDDLGLVHVELELLTEWWKDDPAERDALERRRFLLDAAETLGAHHVKICAELSLSDDEWVEAFDTERLAPNLHRLAVDAADRGTRLALEPMPLTNVVTIREGRHLVETADHPALGLCVDIWHVERGRSSLWDVRNLPAELIVAVEIDDAADERVGSFFEDTIYHRRLPGDGDFDIPGFVSAIRATGYTGPWGVEILSNAHRLRPLKRAVQVAYDTGRRAVDPDFHNETDSGDSTIVRNA